MDGAEPIRIAGIEVPPEQRTPFVEGLLRVIQQQRAEIQQLRDEIARLRGLPRRPAIRPSTLNAPHPDPSRKKRRRGTLRRKVGLQRDFQRLFTRRTGFTDLNEALKRIHEKRDDLLLVLDHPQIPLHNNLSENDIREWAKKRKISAGTRSALGRRCRDTFISLKKTCRKLGVSFWQYLQDRIRGVHEILSLPDLVRQAPQET